MDGVQAEVARQRVERLAYSLWEARGRPAGSPEVDWLRAEKVLASSGEGLGTELPLYDFALEANEESGR